MSRAFALVFSWCVRCQRGLRGDVPQGDVPLGRRASVMVCQRG